MEHIFEKINLSIFEHLAKGGELFIDSIGTVSSKLCIVEKAGSKIMKRVITLSPKSKGLSVADIVKLSIKEPNTDVNSIVEQWYKSVMLENSDLAIRFSINNVITINANMISSTVEIIASQQLQRYLNPMQEQQDNYEQPSIEINQEVLNGAESSSATANTEDNIQNPKPPKSLNDTLAGCNIVEEVSAPSFNITEREQLQNMISEEAPVKTLNEILSEQIVPITLSTKEEHLKQVAPNTDLHFKEKTEKEKKQKVLFILIPCLLILGGFSALVFSGTINIFNFDKGAVTSQIVDVEAVPVAEVDTLSAAPVVEEEVVVKEQIVAKKIVVEEPVIGDRFTPKRGEYYLVIGTFSLRKGAISRADDIEARDYGVYIARPKSLYYVVVPVEDKDNLTSREMELKDKYRDAWFYYHK